MILAHLPLILPQVPPASFGDAAAGGQPPALQAKGTRAVASDLDASIPALMKEAWIPGLQIALVRDGKVVWQKSYGVKNAKTGALVTDDTLFEAASLTKPFFAYAVMKMADEGIIDLDRPLHTFFSRQEIERELGHALDAPGFRRDWFEKATGRHVLSHSGGFPHGERGDVYPLFFEPGTKWKYSADGYYWLQLAAEKLLGRKLDAIMQRYVLGPLGMKRSGMVWRPEFEAVMANGHSAVSTPLAFRKRAEAHAAASLYTTAGEYARFVCAVLNGEGLKRATAKEMLSSFVDMTADKSLGWSLGFGLQSDPNGAAFWQWGDYGIFRNYVIAYPGRRTGVVYLTNSFNGLSVCADIVLRSVGGQALGNAHLNYRRYDSPFHALLREAKEGGPDGIRALLPRLKRDHPDALPRETVGGIAGILAEEGLHAEAVAIHEHISEGNPASGRAAYDLARACLLQGDLEKARASYGRALQAREEKADLKAIQWDLDYLRAAEQPQSLGEADMSKLAGEYEARRITVQDGRLFYFREGGSAPEPRPLLALSKDTFFIKGTVWFKFQVEFDGEGRPVKLVGFYDDGRRDETKRTR
ncbi:MAG: serine hydrolase [Candidatus Aminicenantes bacterium]|nr:serine hydrolase [Candidatus Aminicenantes bacterium]